MNRESLDWAALERLRQRFLAGTAGGANYWTNRSDVACYDATYAQRIGWKWDAVLRELRERGWTPPGGVVLDWGCGSGIAGRRVVEGFGPDRFEALWLFDRSTVAAAFARDAARAAFPALRVEMAEPAWLEGSEPVALLVVSHVLNELTAGDRERLLRLAQRADAVLWVEPGTHADSRALIAVREQLRSQFEIVAPCTHQAGCGLLAPGNERHWCHHFAAPPPGLMADPDWVRFAHRAGIDLRSLPYSFLVLERRGPPSRLRAASGPARVAEGCSRILGRPRFYKGYAKIFSCQADGVRELILPKRVAPELFKQLVKGRAGPVQRWVLAGERITGHEPAAPAGTDSPARVGHSDQSTS